MKRMTAVALLLGLAACGGGEEGAEAPRRRAPEGPAIPVLDSVIAATFDASGIAEPLRRSTLSTKLMGSVTAVLVQEGDRVRTGQVLARVDSRDIEAKRAQVEAGISAAEATHEDALTQARRFRALYADSVATRYQLDQVETGLARAEAGLRTARAAGAELDAVGDYASIRAPFAGVITMRFVDPGAFVAPGAPVVEVQEQDRLRISVQVPPAVARSVRAGQRVDAEIDGMATEAIIEGVVPAMAGGVYTVNAIAKNAEGSLSSGGSATLRLPQGTRRALLVPAAAIIREGDLTGVRIRTPAGSDLRWVKVAPMQEGRVEILAGLAASDSILLPGN